MIPELFQVIAQSQQLLALLCGQLWSQNAGLFQTSLHLGDVSQGVVPSLFQFGGNQTVLRFRCLILSFDAVGLIPRLLQGKLQRTPLFIGLVLAMIQSVERGLHTQRAQGFEDFDSDQLVHACAREGNAIANHLVTIRDRF